MKNFRVQRSSQSTARICLEGLHYQKVFLENKFVHGTVLKELELIVEEMLEWRVVSTRVAGYNTE